MGDVKPSLLVLMAAVGLVLLIACVNTANLLLSRSTERQQEMETRMALGASGGRLARQLLTESVVSALTGGIVGLAITPWVLHGLVAIAAKSLPRAVHTSIDFRALALTTAVSLATGTCSGWCRRCRRAADNFDTLKSGKNTEGRRPRRLRSALVICETALSLLILAGAGLLLRSFAQILKIDPGFRPDGVLTLRVSLPDAVYSKPEQLRSFYSQLLDRVQKLPGVQSAGAVSALPLSADGGSGTTTVDSQSVPLENTTPEADQRIVTPDYFKAMGISLVSGRFFDGRDSDTAPHVAIVDESLAQTFWPNQDAVGKRLHQGGRGGANPSWDTVIGVVRHVRNRTLEARSRVEVYWPATQRPVSAMTLAVLTSGTPMSSAPTIQREVASMDPDLPVYRVHTMTEVMGESLQRRRLALILLAVFAGLAMLLASVGIYGVTSYAAAQRKVEIGVRMALGADRGQVLRMMLGSGMGTIAIGIGVGILLSFALMRLMSGMLFAVRASDPLTLGGAGLILLAAAFVAIFLPARRATRVNPMIALRYE